MKKLIRQQNSKLSDEKAPCGDGLPARLRSKVFTMRFFEGMARSPLSMEILRHSVWQRYVRMTGSP